MSDTVAVAAITAIAGLGSAAIGAYMSHKRTRATFAHERDLRDIEQARQRLSNVLDTGEKSLRVLMDLQPELVVGMREQADTQLDKAGALNTELAREIRRLMLILNRRDSLVQATMDYRASFGPVSEYLEALASGAPQNDETWKVALSGVARTHARVIDIAVERIGSGLGEPVN